MFVYSCPPLDNGWHHLPTVKDVAKDLASKDAAVRVELGLQCRWDITADEFLERWEVAKSAASSEGWEGNFREEPRVLWLPDQTGFTYGFVFKQDNNGTTFIVSPFEMPWVERF